jgi:hypothetical protein
MLAAIRRALNSSTYGRSASTYGRSATMQEFST